MLAWELTAVKLYKKLNLYKIKFAYQIQGNKVNIRF